MEQRCFACDRRTSIVIGSTVFSHWVLDSIVYSTLPVFFGHSQLVRFGLLNSGPGVVIGIVLEISLIAGGIAVYLVTRKRTTESAREYKKLSLR